MTPNQRVRFVLLALPVLALLVGCSEMSQEDREFYGRGWIHPGELDQERPTKMPAHPETTGSLGSAPAAGTSVPGTGGDEWTAPPRY